MSKNYKLFIIFIVFASGLTFIFIMSNNLKIKENKACINKNCFNVEIAETPEERSRGLMYRESLDEGSGMLFIFDQEKRHSFWMKNTLIPLDIIWLDKNTKVVYIKKNAQPCKKDPCQKYRPSQKAMYVLEVNPQSNIEIGDKIIFK